MFKICIALLIAVVVCGSLCYAVNRVCNVIDGKGEQLSSEHSVLAKDHEAIMHVLVETKSIVNENNRMLTVLYNMATQSNPDLKMQ